MLFYRRYLHIAQLIEPPASYTAAGTTGHDRWLNQNVVHMKSHKPCTLSWTAHIRTHEWAIRCKPWLSGLLKPGVPNASTHQPSSTTNDWKTVKKGAQSLRTTTSDHCTGSSCQTKIVVVRNQAMSFCYNLLLHSFPCHHAGPADARSVCRHQCYCQTDIAASTGTRETAAALFATKIVD